MKLQLEHVTAGYGRQPIIFDVNVDFHPNTLTTIIGPNGAGKSTLIKAVFGQARVFSGGIRVSGELVDPSDRTAMVRAGVAYVPQLANVFPSLTVRENLEIGTYIRGNKEQIARVVDLFPVLGEVLTKTAGHLSGGQRNMLAVARALMSEPRLILLDEPTAGLAPRVAATLWGHLETLRATGVTLIVVAQNVKLALAWAEEVLLLTGGQVRLESSVRDLDKSSINIEEAFLGA